MTKHWLAALAGLASCAAISAAFAQTPGWPPNILGTWRGFSNQSPIVLSISSETSGAQCHNITGTIEDVKGGFTGTMIGFYCPYSGNVHFLRYADGSNVPFQAYYGSLSQKSPPAGEGLLMGGVFGQYSLAYGPLGQASFSLTR